MYNNEQIKQFQQLTHKWLTHKGNTQNETEELRDVLRFHEHRYYVENNPLISDFEYDSLYNGFKDVFVFVEDIILAPFHPFLYFRF